MSSQRRKDNPGGYTFSGIQNGLQHALNNVNTYAKILWLPKDLLNFMSGDLFVHPTLHTIMW